jgi:plastocyanin
MGASNAGLVRALACAFTLAAGTSLSHAATISGVVSDAAGKPVADAVVFIERPAGQASGSAPKATMDQINKTFVPGVLPIMAGTSVSFPNHDQIHHHVYSFSRTKTFELPLYKGTDASPVVFDKVGVVKVGCNIHDWMSGIILVLPTPWFARTGSDGRFTLADVPEGQHKVVAWHEHSKQKPEDTAKSVEAGAATAEANFTLTISAPRARPAVRGSRRDP